MSETPELAITYVFAGIFLILPPTLFVSRFICAKPPWWIIFPVIIVIGWGAYLLAVVSYYDALISLIESLENPSDELLERANSDGAPLVMALFGGGVLAFIYALPWWGIFLVATTTRNLVQSRK